MGGAMRICSFLPSATEMLFALGLGDRVVAVSHQCDFPPEALTRPRATRSLIDAGAMSSAEIDAAVSRAFAEGLASYSIDMDVLSAVRPDIVITQDLCVVCAIGGSDVRRAAADLEPAPRIVSLEPHSVEDVLSCLLTLGAETETAERAQALVRSLRARIAAVQAAVAGAARPRVVCLEWVDPTWIAGHWMPEVVELAGGIDVLGRSGEPSRRATWDEIADAEPDVAIVMPCGFGVERGLQEVAVLESIPDWRRTPAVREDRAWVVDASSYYSRSGPRTVDGIELMAAILHPDAFPRGLPDDQARQLHSAATAGTPRQAPL
jgi:iron complex transport system substrate-binding protein